MRKRLLYFLVFLVPFFISAQREFHVYPQDKGSPRGNPTGDGSMDKPWDLQTALSQPASVVKGGDIIWIHGGIYTGRFISTLSSKRSDKKITVSAVDGETVVLNGNTKSTRGSVLEVKGANVIYRNLEITFLGQYPRNPNQAGFQKVNGVFHTLGEDCEFVGLRIHNNPGVGFGSWKSTGGTIIEYCKVYNNGHPGKKKGVGEGFYVQNQSEKERIIRNNFIFNNYYKGVEVWSASSGKGFEFVKNVRLENNVIFNNGLPGGKHVDNVIIASHDNEGVNVARNIKVIDNIFYHNIDIKDKANYGEGASFTLGFNKNSPVEEVKVNGNLIIGKSNGLRFLYVKSMEFKGNTVYTGYVDFYPASMRHLADGRWKLSNNSYYTRKAEAFRVLKSGYHKFGDWQKKFSTDQGSTWDLIRNLRLNEVYIQKSPQNNMTFDVAVFNSEAGSILVDFGKHLNDNNLSYKVRNLANGNLIDSGLLNDSKIIEIKSGNYNGTQLNFGVYTVEFSKSEDKKRKTFLGRLFGWIF